VSAPESKNLIILRLALSAPVLEKRRRFRKASADNFASKSRTLSGSQVALLYVIGIIMQYLGLSSPRPDPPTSCNNFPNAPRIQWSSMASPRTVEEERERSVGQSCKVLLSWFGCLTALVSPSCPDVQSCQPGCYRTTLHRMLF
jgi:hypothetical protein